MPNYDSDSSSDDDETGYQTTNVTLGYASTESTGDEISHIGGYEVSEKHAVERHSLICIDMAR